MWLKCAEKAEDDFSNGISLLYKKTQFFSSRLRENRITPPDMKTETINITSIIIDHTRIIHAKMVAISLFKLPPCWIATGSPPAIHLNVSRL